MPQQRRASAVSHAFRHPGKPEGRYKIVDSRQHVARVQLDILDVLRSHRRPLYSLMRRRISYLLPTVSFFDARDPFGFFAAADPLPDVPLPETLPCLAAASASICLIRLFGRISVQFFSMKSRHS